MGRLRELSVDECVELLSANVVGRAAICTPSGPHVVPVNYAVDGDSIVFRTTPYSVLGTYGWAGDVAFEVDHIEPISHTGWSVLVTGTACELFDPVDLARAARLPLAAWAPGEHSHYVRISSDLVSGRRLTTEVLTGQRVG